MRFFKKIFSMLGPGFVSGASDDDPSGIGTYAQTGAQFGYGQLWTPPFSFPFMVVVQEMCGRVGMVTGKGLANVIRKHYSRRLLFSMVALLFLANTINIGADLGAMAASGQLVFGIPFAFWLIAVTAVSVILQIYVPYPTYARFLKYLAFSLLSYIVVAFVVKQPWDTIIAHTFVPTFTFSKAYLFNFVAILGTTISPYLFFWEADQEAEEDFTRNRVRSYGKGVPKVTSSDIRDMRLDTVIGMVFSNLVMFFIMVTAASTLHASGITSVETADQAALALKPFAGEFASALFAIGVIGTGLLAVPVLAGSASYALSEAMGWRAGLHNTFKKARAFYWVIIISTLIGALINFIGIPPFKMLYYTAVLNGIIAPPLLILLMRIGNNKKILGEHVNGPVSNILGWTIAIIMSAAALALIVTSVL